MQAKWHLSLMEMIAEADRSEIYLSEGLSSTADWLARFLGIGYMSALKLTEVAVALQGLPKLAEAYRCGRVSYDHLRALVQVADEENEQALLAEVEGTSVADTYRLVRRILEVSAEDARLNRQDRCLEMRWDHETRNLYLFGRLPEDQGAKVERAIDAIARRMPEDPAFDPWPTPAGAKRADALCALADSFLSQNPSVPQVVVHVEAEALSSGKGVGEIEDGPTICLETVRRIMCDASVKWVAEGKDGNPIGMGSLQRCASRALKRELKRRDRRCRFSGCRRKKGLHAHHIVAAPEGKTKPPNLVMLCGTHHHLVHEWGYEVRGSPPKVFFEHPKLPPIKMGPPKLDPETVAFFELEFEMAGGAARGP